MPINYLYPEADISSGGFSPIGAPSLYEALDESPYSTSDTSYAVANAGASNMDLWLGDNTVFPSSVSMTFRCSQIGGDGISETNNGNQTLTVSGLIFNADDVLVASGAIINSSTSYIVNVPFTVDSGVQNLTLSELSDLKLRVLYNFNINYTPESTYYRFFYTKEFRIHGIEIAVSGDNIPEAYTMPLFINGPCNHKGELDIVNDYLTVSSDFYPFTSDTEADSTFGVSSHRFGIPNFHRSFTRESGYIRVGEDARGVGDASDIVFPPVVGGSGTEVAFYGDADLNQGQIIYGLDVDGIEFWSDYSSGTLRVYGNSLSENIDFQSYNNGVFRFSGGDWHNVEARVDLNNDNIDFRFIAAASGANGNVIVYNPLLANRLDTFISTSGETNRIYTYSTSSAIATPIFSTGIVPRALKHNLINRNLYFLDEGSGLYALNLSNSGVTNLVNDRIYDIDISYEDGKLYYITPSSLNSINAFISGAPQLEHSFSTTLNYPKLGVYNPTKMVVSSISGHIYKGLRPSTSQPWTFSQLPSTEATYQHAIEQRYFISGYTGSLIIRDSTIYRYDYDTGFLTSFSLAAPSGIVGVGYNEFNGHLFMAVPPNRLHRYTLIGDTVDGSFNFLVGIGTNYEQGFTLKNNKNFLATSSGLYDLRALGNCCDTAPSGFVQLEAGYTDDSYFGYPDASIISDNNYIWRSKQQDLIRIGSKHTFSTVGYHDYEINSDENIYSSWRDAQLEFKIHTFKNTSANTVAPTGFLSLDAIEYRYEDCYTASVDDNIDLFMLAGISQEDVPLYTFAANPEDADTDLYVLGGMGVRAIPMYISGFMRTANDDIPLFILPRDSGELSEDIPLYMHGGISVYDNIPLYLFNYPSDDMTLFIEGTQYDSQSGIMPLFINSTAESSVYKAVPLFMGGKTTEDMTLFIKCGNGDDTANMTLYVQGMQSDGLGYLNLMLHNMFEAASGDFDLFLSGPDGSGVNDDMTLYIGNDVNGSGPNLISSIGMTINSTVNIHDSSVPMSIFGAFSTNDAVTLVLPSSIGTPDKQATLYTHGF